MSDINHEDWLELQDAYGSANQIPDFLNQVISDKSNNSQTDAWNELWSRLCHQDSIYSASIVAVPFIVDCIKNSKDLVNFNFFLLPASIEIARQESKEFTIPLNIKNQYLTSIDDLGKLAKIYLTGDIRDNNLIRAVKIAKYVSEGNYDAANGLIDT